MKEELLGTLVFIESNIADHKYSCQCDCDNDCDCGETCNCDDG